MKLNRKQTKTKRQGISNASLNNEKIRLLMPHFTKENLKRCFQELPKDRAAGVDGITKEVYGKRLEENIDDLHRRLRSMNYHPKQSRRVQIPKGQGKTRPLDIPNLEDKIVQLLMKKSLEAVYEPLFLDCSFGYRSGRNPHMAVKATKDFLYKSKVCHVLDLDLSNFFGEINHDKLLKILEMRIGDKRFIRYVARFLKAGYSEGTRTTRTSKGSAQGSLISPILSNIYAHYCIDLWFENQIKPNLENRAQIVRFADDICILFLSQNDANKTYQKIEARLTRFDLLLNKEKSKSLTFNKFKAPVTKQPTFDFLGFTFYIGESHKGFPVVKVKTSRKKFRSFLVGINDWLQKARSAMPLRDLHQGLSVRLKGHLNYFAVTFNGKAICKVVHFAKRILFRWLNRRSQKRSLNWEQFNRYLKVHPFPDPKTLHSLF